MFITALKIGAFAIALSSLTGCVDGNFPGPYPAASSMHYGPPHRHYWHHMHYGPPRYYPSVTVTDRYRAPRSESMHYGPP